MRGVLKFGSVYLIKGSMELVSLTIWGYLPFSCQQWFGEVSENYPVGGPSGLAGSSVLVAFDLRLLWLILPSVGEDTHRDNSGINNLLIENWVTRISLQCVSELFPTI